MTSPSTTIDYTATPGSEISTYFDAPLMIWNKASSEAPENANEGSPSSKDKFPGAFVEHLDDGTNLSRKPSVGIPRDPVVRRAPADGDEEAHPASENDNIYTGNNEEGNDANRSPSRSHRRSTSLAMTDSGYGSAGNAPRPQSRASDRKKSMEPIPILWTDSNRTRNQWASDDNDEDTHRDGNSKQEYPYKRASSLRSFRSPGSRASTVDAGDRGSIRTTPGSIGRMSSTPRRRVSLVGGSFASGAGTVGPASSVVLDDTFHMRSRSAELGLTEKQKLKLGKNQIKEGKKVAKIIKAEGKAEKKALDEALHELADLQKLQKAAVKAESKSYAGYSKALREFHKAELEFFAARAKYERFQADLQAQEDARDASRSQAMETTEMLQEKNREVEWLRAQKAVDDREREAKVRQLTGKV